MSDDSRKRPSDDQTRERIDTERLKELAKRRLVLDVPEMQRVAVRRDIAYKASSGEQHLIDVYCPRESPADALPAVLFVAGYPDKGLRQLLGIKLKDMGAYVSWGQFVAASGMAAITCSCATPVSDSVAILEYLRKQSHELNIDPQRIGIWATSGNGPTALSLLMAPESDLRFAVLSNAYMLDLDGTSTISKMSKTFGFAAPNSGRTVADLPAGTPMLVVRSGEDEVPGLNDTIDRFVAAALNLDRPVTLINVPGAPHSFDIWLDSKESRAAIRQMLSFMRLHLDVQDPAAYANV
jgi:hypothetical protein